METGRKFMEEILAQMFACRYLERDGTTGPLYDKIHMCKSDGNHSTQIQR